MKKKEEHRDNNFGQQKEAMDALLDDLKNIRVFDEDKAWKNINREIGSGTKRILPVSILKYAASLIFFLAAIGFAYFYFIDNVELKNGSEQSEIYVLNDQSEVILAPGAKLTHKRNFNWFNRRISFEGEAYFNIKNLNTEDFEILMQATKIKVLGTSFYIQKDKEGKTQYIDLVEGKIELTGLDNLEQLYLESGQKAIITNELMMESFGENDDFVNARSWEPKAIQLDNVSIKQACSTINLAYGKEVIRIKGEGSEECVIHTIVKPGQLQDFFEELEILFKIKVRNYKGRFVIEDINCKS